MSSSSGSRSPSRGRARSPRRSGSSIISTARSTPASEICAALGADHPYVALLQSVPGIGSILAYTIASEIADISPFSTAKNFVDYTGLCPRVYRSGGVDRRGRIAKNGPTYLRWALIEASIHACHHPLYQPAYDRTKARLGRSRGGEIARIELGRQLTESIWHMLTEGECFAPARSQACALVA